MSRPRGVWNLRGSRYRGNWRRQLRQWAERDTSTSRPNRGGQLLLYLEGNIYSTLCVCVVCRDMKRQAKQDGLPDRIPASKPSPAQPKKVCVLC